MKYGICIYTVEYCSANKNNVLKLFNSMQNAISDTSRGEKLQTTKQ